MQNVVLFLIILVHFADNILLLLSDILNAGVFLVVFLRLLYWYFW